MTTPTTTETLIRPRARTAATPARARAEADAAGQRYDEAQRRQAEAWAAVQAAKTALTQAHWQHKTAVRAAEDAWAEYAEADDRARRAAL
jgi:hypothetical protein